MKNLPVAIAPSWVLFCAWTGSRGGPSSHPDFGVGVCDGVWVGLGWVGFSSGVEFLAVEQPVHRRVSARAVAARCFVACFTKIKIPTGFFPRNRFRTICG